MCSPAIQITQERPRKWTYSSKTEVLAQHEKRRILVKNQPNLNFKFNVMYAITTVNYSASIWRVIESHRRKLRLQLNRIFGRRCAMYGNAICADANDVQQGEGLPIGEACRVYVGHYTIIILVPSRKCGWDCYPIGKQTIDLRWHFVRN